MSRVAKAPVTIPAGVEVTLNGQELSIKGGKGFPGSFHPRRCRSDQRRQCTEVRPARRHRWC